MKKILIIFAALFISTFAFADEGINKGLYLNTGFSYNETTSLDFFDYKTLGRPLSTKETHLEIGRFASDEDGLIDIVHFDLLGLGFGSINTRDNYVFRLYGNPMIANTNANSFRIYNRETWGPQFNFFVVSAGLLFGTKFGFDGTSFEFINQKSDINTIYYDYKIFFDICSTPYICANIGHFAKVFLISNIDYPFLRIRFISTDSIEKEQKDNRIEWFDGELPFNVTLGVCFFL